MAADPPDEAPGGEFHEIARLYRPLTGGSPEALDLLDDAAVLPSRAGFDLVITKDAMVEGVHFLPGEPLDLVARKLLRANLSDLAAKAAEPHGYLLAVAWPHGTPFEVKARFAAGLAQDQASFGVRLLGGDTVSTSGPLVASLTLLGWTPEAAMVKRSGARPGEVVLVSGTIGDAGLGLDRLKAGTAGDDELVLRHRLPTPRLALRSALRRQVSAAADVSDGLIADAGHIATASGCAISLALDAVPLSRPARAWLSQQPDPVAAHIALATSGDDYEIVCTAPRQAAADLMQEAANAGAPLAIIGEVEPGQGVRVRWRGQEVPVLRRGWTHG